MILHTHPSPTPLPPPSPSSIPPALCLSPASSACSHRETSPCNETSADDAPGSKRACPRLFLGGTHPTLPFCTCLSSEAFHAGHQSLVRQSRLAKRNAQKPKGPVRVRTNECCNLARGLTGSWGEKKKKENATRLMGWGNGVRGETERRRGESMRQRRATTSRNREKKPASEGGSVRLLVAPESTVHPTIVRAACADRESTQALHGRERDEKNEQQHKEKSSGGRVGFKG